MPYTEFEFLQTQLTDNLFTFIDPAHTQDAIGLLNALQSGGNLAGRRLEPLFESQGGGKIQKVKISFTQRFTSADVVDNSNKSCDGGPKKTEFTKTYDIDSTAGKSIVFNVDEVELQRNGRDVNFAIAELVQQAMNQLNRSFNTEFVTTVAANFGNHAQTGTTAPVAVKTLKSNGEDFFSQFISGVRRSFRRANSTARPIVIGEGLVFDWFEDGPSGLQDSGDDIPEHLRRHPMDFHYDENIEGVLGANEFIAIAPGTIQLIPFVEFAGADMIRNDSIFKRGVFIDPATRIPFDVIMNDKCGVWNCQVKTVQELKFLPTNLANASDKMDGVNWVFNFVVSN